MDSSQVTPAIDDVAPERQSLLSSPLVENGESDEGNAAGEDDAYMTANAHQDILLACRAKLGASALNFLLSGIAMAAVGASPTQRTLPCLEDILIFTGHAPKCKQNGSFR